MKIVWMLIVLSGGNVKAIEFNSLLGCEWEAYSIYYYYQTECRVEWVFDV